MKLYKYISGSALIVLLGFSACSSDDFAPDNNGVSGNSIPLTLTVSRGDIMTRTNTSQNDEGGLTSVWSTTDKLIIFTSAGEEAGYLNYYASANDTGTTAYFTGSLNKVDESGNYCIWYFGSAYTNGSSKYLDFSEKDDNNNPIVTINLNNQDFRSAEALSAVDVMYSNATIDLRSDGAHVHGTDNINMIPVLAMAHFSLEGLPNSAGTLLVTDEKSEENGSSTVVSSRLRLNDGGVVAKSPNDGFSSEINAGDKDVYMAFIPGEYTMRFTYMDNSTGNFYTKKFNSSTTLEAGKYYSSIGEMIPSASSSVKFDVTKIDQNGLPLSRWASTNLERLSLTEYYRGKFSETYKENGGYYQFGRQIGFKNVEEAQLLSLVYSPTSNTDISKGVGDMSTYINDKGAYYYQDSSSKWLGTDLGKKSFLIPCYYEEYDEYYYGPAKDWWPSTSPNPQDWNSRASSSFYTPSDLYTIDGVKYKIPSIDDFKEILPSSDIINQNSTDKFSVLVESKKESSESLIAYRWKKVKEGNSYYLEIKSCRIPNKSCESIINWDSEIIVTRYFKAAGYIVPHYSSESIWKKITKETYGRVEFAGYIWDAPTSQTVNFTVQDENESDSYLIDQGFIYEGQQEVAKALNSGNYMCSINKEVQTYNIKYSDYYIINGNLNADPIFYVDLIINYRTDFMPYIGSYWTSDASRTAMTFVFDENNVVGVDGIYMEDETIPFACSIRLIKDETK